MSAAIWKTLGIGKTDDKAAIRRAYAARLKALDVDNDVAGFAKLRQARDTALRMAAAAARAQEAPPAPEDDLAIDGVLDDGAHLGLAADDWLIDAPSPTDPVEAPLPDPVADELAAAERRVPDLLNALAALLFPNGDYSDEGFTLADFEAAQAHVADLITEARTARLEVTHAIDHHLAEMMAQGWPRSAALVNAPAEEFHWLEEAGSLDERPALRFLNDRIKGMRFAEKVQARDHPLNKAWAELTREGDKVTWAHRRAVNSADVANLLTGIRQRFPEVESYLNAERVAVWERRFVGGRVSSDSINFWPLLVIGFIFLRIIVGFAGGSEKGETTDPVPTSFFSAGGMAPASQSDFVQEAQLAINVIVGAENADRLQNDANLFDSGLRNTYKRARQQGGDHAEGLLAARNYARTFALLARQNADFSELVAIDEMLRRWLRAAEGTGNLGADCPYLTNSSKDMGDIAIDYRDEEAEQSLYIQLLDAGLLAEQPDSVAASARVPGDVIEAIMAQTGLPLATVREALQDDGHPQRCKVMLATLDKVLERPADVSADLLRML